MGLFDRLRGKDKQQRDQQPINEKAGLSENDRQTLMEALEKGTPCIPFIPINALRQSQTVLKEEGFKGFFIARIPALYEDGTIKYLYKEEFMLFLAASGILSQMEEKGRTYFFLGLEQPIEMPPGYQYVDPKMFYQNNLTLHNVEFSEKMEFSEFAHAPGLTVTYIPADRGVKVSKASVVNFTLVARLHPEDEREDPSGVFQSYEEWKSASYPTSGDELRQMIRFHVQVCKDALGKEEMKRKAEYELQFYILGLIEHQRALAEAGYKFPKLEGKCPFCGGVVGETITSLVDGYGKEKPVYLYTCLNKACSCELYATHRYEYVSYEKL